MSPENGWNFIKQKEKLPEVSWPSDAKDPTPIFEKTENPQLYWNYFSEHQQDIMDWLKENQTALKFYFDLLEAPYFIDNDPATFKAQRGGIGALMDYHRLTWLYLSGLVEGGKIEDAYPIWLKMFRQDLAWAQSARSLLSHMASLSCLVNDLNFLKILKTKGTAPQWEEIQQELVKLHPDSLHLKRALAFEYALIWGAFENIREETEGIKRYFLFLNFALSKQVHNEMFTQHLNLLKDPLNPPKDYKEKILKAIGKENFFWWFVNPSGKLILNAASLHYEHNILKYYLNREEIFKLKESLLKK